MAKSYRPAGVGMVPAQPGTYLLHAYFDGNEVDLVRANVVGWQVSSERTLTPLVVDPRAADFEPLVIGHPDGRIECTDGRCWDNLEAWLAEERRIQRAALNPVVTVAPVAAAPAPVPTPAPVPAAAPAPAPPPRPSERPPSAPYAAPRL